MSFILDALKKSEAERQRQAGPALLEMRVVRPQRRMPVWLIVVGALLIVVNLGGLLWLLLRPAPAARPDAGGCRHASDRARSGRRHRRPRPPARRAARARRTPDRSGRQWPAGSLAAGGTTCRRWPAPRIGPVAGDVNPADFLPAEAAPRAARSGAALRNYADVSNVSAAHCGWTCTCSTPVRRMRYAFINMKKLREGESTRRRRPGAGDHARRRA